MANTVSVDQLANVIMQGLTEYADAQSDMVKQTVKDVSKEVKKEISVNAPKRTGAYKKSWATKKTKETSNLILLQLRFTQRTGIRLRIYWNMAMRSVEEVELLQSHI